MLHEFCTWFTAMIRRLGYDPHTADCLALFVIRCMTLVWAVMDVLDVPQPALWESAIRTKNPAAGSFTHTIIPAAPFIQHRLPA